MLNRWSLTRRKVPRSFRSTERQLWKHYKQLHSSARRSSTGAWTKADEQRVKKLQKAYDDDVAQLLRVVTEVRRRR